MHYRHKACGSQSQFIPIHLNMISYAGYANCSFILHLHTHTRLTALSPGLPRWAGTRKEKPIWILLKQETVSGSVISWNICKSAPRSRQITMPTPHHSVFYRPDALPAAQPTASKHWRHLYCIYTLPFIPMESTNWNFLHWQPEQNYLNCHSM